jgi:membrane protease subunit HflK
MENQGEPGWKDILLSGMRSIPYRSHGFITAVVVVVVGIYFVSGIYAVQPEELGVVVRFGRVVADGVPPGIHYHLPAPFEKVHKPKTAEIKKIFVGMSRGEGRRGAVGGGLEMVTGDTNIILVQVIIQYAISQPVNYLFAVENATKLIEAASEEALTKIVGSMSVDGLLTTEKIKAHTFVI